MCNRLLRLFRWFWVICRKSLCQASDVAFFRSKQSISTWTVRSIRVQVLSISTLVHLTHYRRRTTIWGMLWIQRGWTQQTTKATLLYFTTISKLILQLQESSWVAGLLHNRTQILALSKKFPITIPIPTALRCTQRAVQKYLARRS